MRYGLIFPGQGGQHAGMLRWLTGNESPARSLEAVLDPGWRDKLNDQAWATRNAVAQPLVVGVALSAWERLREQLPTPIVVAGYSVGEVGAQCAAGVFDATEALRLSCMRAQYMDDAAAGEALGLAGVTGLDDAQIDTLCTVHNLERAIRNGPDSVVLGGRDADLESVAAEVERTGGRLKRLPVTIASHTSWMERASANLADELAALPFARPSFPLLDGEGNLVRTASDAKQALVRPISKEIRWDLCIEAVVGRRVDCVLELGPGSALSRLWKQRCPDIPVRSADEFGSAEAIVNWLERHG